MRRTILELSPDELIEKGKKMIAQGSNTRRNEIRGRGKWLVEFGQFIITQGGLFADEAISYKVFEFRVKSYLIGDLEYFGDLTFQKNDVVGEYSEVPGLIQHYLDNLVFGL